MANSSSGESVTDRVVRVLETFTPTRTAQTVSEIGRRANLPMSTAHRIVGELVIAGLLERDEQLRVRIGLRLWELATRGSSALRMRQVALPFMERVQSRVREHTQLVVLEEDEALCVERLLAPSSGENITVIAGRLPLHACSSGLVLLANGDAELQERVLSGRLQRMSEETITDPGRLRELLATVRREGHVVAPGHVSAVSTGIAVPVHDRAGATIAALAVVLPRKANPEPALMELKSAARGLGRALHASA